MSLKIKSFRLRPEVITALSNVAKERGITESSLVSELLEGKLKIIPLLKSYHGICLEESLFRAIVAHIDTSRFEILASEYAKHEMPLTMELLELRRDESSLIWFLKEILSAIGWFDFVTKYHDDKVKITLFHNFGIRWTAFLKSYLTSMFDSIAHVSLEFEENEKFIVFVVNKSSV